MYNNFAAGSTLSCQPGQRASCSTFKAWLVIGVLLRIGGVQLLACCSTAAARRLCSVLQTIFAAVNCSTLVQRDERGSSKPLRAAGQRWLALFVSKLRAG